MVDGWTSQGYGDVPSLAAGAQAGMNLQFSPDSKRFGFLATNGLSSFVVVDGQESAGYGTIRNFQFSSDSKRYGFEAFAGHGQGWLAVMDGKPGPKLHDLWRDIAKRYFVFSRDGKHLAYVNGHHGSGQGVVMVDGRPQVLGNLFTQPTFSSDGKRFAHFVWVDQKWLLVIDGSSAPIDGDLSEDYGSARVRGGWITALPDGQREYAAPRCRDDEGEHQLRYCGGRHADDVFCNAGVGNRAGAVWPGGSN